MLLLLQWELLLQVDFKSNSSYGRSFFEVAKRVGFGKGAMSSFPRKFFTFYLEMAYLRAFLMQNACDSRI